MAPQVLKEPEIPMSCTSLSISVRLRDLTSPLPVSVSNHNKYIPGLPFSLTEVLNLWIFESPLFKPVRLFLQTYRRRRLVPNYTHASWAYCSQKHAYLRFKDIVMYVHEYAPVACDVREEGNDQYWNIAITHH